MHQVTLVLVAMVVASPALGRLSLDCTGASEPDFNTLIFRDKLHSSFYQMDSLRALLENSSSVPAQFRCPYYSYLHGPRQCPTWTASVGTYGGSLCPSYNVLNHDENRYPPTLVEARCSCSSCLAHPDQSRNVSSLLFCKPVKYYTPVFRRVGCQDNEYQYKQVWEPLTVACSCSAPLTAVVPPRRPPSRNVPPRFQAGR